MKRIASFPGSLVGMSLVLALALASCTKEELVAPANAVNGTSKNTPSNSGNPPSHGGGYATPKSGDAGSTGTGTGISDDGDDISGSERNRKKAS